MEGNTVMLYKPAEQTTLKQRLIVARNDVIFNYNYNQGLDSYFNILKALVLYKKYNYYFWSQYDYFITGSDYYKAQFQWNFGGK